MATSATKVSLTLLAVVLMAAGSAAAIPMANHPAALSGLVQGTGETSDMGGLYGGGGGWSAPDLTTNRNAVAAHSDCAPVPEPGTLLLVGASLAGLALRRRRSR